MSFAQELNDGFSIFIGVDQTGASCDKGQRAKALPCAVLDQRAHRPRLHLSDRNNKPLFLTSFNRPSLCSVLVSVGFSQIQAEALFDSSQMAILADCVFGLPKEAWVSNQPPGSPTLWGIFRKAARDTETRKGFGLNAAAEFFKDVLNESRYRGANPYPVRKCELLAKANSVFRTHPFQKNIQCGTYRIWRDLGQAQKPWVNIRYFENRKRAHRSLPWLFEADPSMMWRDVLGLRTRNLGQVLTSVERNFPRLGISQTDEKLFVANADRADAAVLALAGAWLQKRRLLFSNAPNQSRDLAKEGWIVGLTDS